MLIINNGSPKTGTTWIQQIAVRLLKPAFPSPEWANEWKNPSIDRDKLPGYFDSGEWQAGPVLIKTHQPYAEDLAFTAENGVKVILSHRNLADSVVSMFHHQVRLGTADASDPITWFETKGRRFAVQSVTYQQSWTGRPNTISIRYEDMLQDCAAEISKLMAFLEAPVSEAAIKAAAEKTMVSKREDGTLIAGPHIRTAGVSSAEEELPSGLFAELTELQALVEQGPVDAAVLDQIKPKTPKKVKVRDQVTQDS